MNEISDSGSQIRPVTRDDLPGLLEMVRELAEFEKLLDQVEATESLYEEAFFSPNPAAEALVAEKSGALVGYAIYFTTFSSFTGRAGIWLEDLYVRPDHRGERIGKELIRRVGAIAAERNAGRCEWCVLDWNQRAIDLYESIGGEILGEWRIVRMGRDGIRDLPNR